MSDLTVGELRQALAGYTDETVLELPGNLTFYRIKRWGDDGAIVEVNEVLADLAPAFRKRNPHVGCAFIKTPFAEGELISGPVSVTVF